MTNYYKSEGYTVAELFYQFKLLNLTDYKIKVVGDGYIEGFFHGVVTDFYFNDKEKVITLEAEER